MTIPFLIIAAIESTATQASIVGALSVIHDCVFVSVAVHRSAKAASDHAKHVQLYTFEKDQINLLLESEVLTTRTIAKTVVNLEVSAAKSSLRISMLIQGLPIALKIVIPSQNQMLSAASKPQR